MATIFQQFGTGAFTPPQFGSVDPSTGGYTAPTGPGLGQFMGRAPNAYTQRVAGYEAANPAFNQPAPQFGGYANTALGSLRGVQGALQRQFQTAPQDYASAAISGLMPQWQRDRKQLANTLVQRGIGGARAGRQLVGAQARGEEEARQNAILGGLNYQRQLGGDLANLARGGYDISRDAALQGFGAALQGHRQRGADVDRWLGHYETGEDRSLRERQFGADLALRGSGERRAYQDLAARTQLGYRDAASRDKATAAQSRYQAGQLAHQRQTAAARQREANARLALAAEQDRRKAAFDAAELAYLPRQRAISEMIALMRRQPVNTQTRPSSGLATLIGAIGGIGQRPIDRPLPYKG